MGEIQPYAVEGTEDSKPIFHANLRTLKLKLTFVKEKLLKEMNVLQIFYLKKFYSFFHMNV